MPPKTTKDKEVQTSFFSVQNSLFLGCAHGTMITIYETDLQFWSANSKLNGRILSNQKTEVPKLLWKNNSK